MSVIVYTSKITTRLQYIATFVSDTFFNKQIQLTDNRELFKSSENFGINYSSERLTATEFHIQPIHLLFDESIVSQPVECFDWQGLKVFFRTGGDLSFDIFAATFYLITRYEEYLPHAKDEFGRYAHINSLAYKEHFLLLPLINIWWQRLIDEFIKKYGHSTFYTLYSDSVFQFLPTYDIDIAYSYLAKGWLRNAGGLIKEITEGKWQIAKQRINVLKGKARDPFDSYDWLQALHARHKLKPVFFFLLAEKKKAFDKNNNPYSFLIERLVRQHAKLYTTGIHPSWQSGDNFTVLLQEISILEKITGRSVTKSRQHYIRMLLPYTYRLLIKAGITEDFSMGYGSINGFRASAASPFYWYDLEKEQQTHLLIHPFCYMEANSIFEQQYTAAEAAKELQHYYNITKQVNGRLITIFHNHFLTEEQLWLPWRKMYEAFLHKNF